MSGFDLNINNYTLEDLLNLFRLDYNFTMDDLKKAKKIALRTHPDKSGLDQQVFLFFLKAYKMCETIYKFRVKRQDLNLNTTFEYENLETLNEKQKEKILYKKLNGKSAKEFNKWFNDMFEKVKMHDEELDEGYDLVVGNRFLGGIEKKAMPLANRIIGNPALSFIARKLFNTHIRDFHCGLRGFTKKAYKDMNLTSSGMEFATEMIAKASLINLKITEIPTTLKNSIHPRTPHLKPIRDGLSLIRKI